MSNPGFPLTPALFNEAIPMIPVSDATRLDEAAAMENALQYFNIYPARVDVKTVEEKNGFPVFRQSFIHWDGFFWTGRKDGWVEGEAFALSHTKTAMEKRWPTEHPGEPLPDVSWTLKKNEGPFFRTQPMPWPETTAWATAMIELLPVLGQARMEQENLGKNLPESRPANPVFRL